MATTTALDFNRNTRWSQQNLDTCRARRRTDATIAKHVAILEGVAKAHDGVLPPYRWLQQHGYFQSYQVMMENPTAFKHIKTAREKEAEMYRAPGAPQILPPANFHTLAEYNIEGAFFHPIELKIDAGLSEGEWMAIGRTLATLEQSVKWWVGDFILYGERTFGKVATYDLAQQATGYTRAMLYDCARIAKRFPPERRQEALSFFHHTSVQSLPPAVADKLLGEAVELGLTGRQIRELGQEEVGGGKRKPRFEYAAVHLKMSPSLYDRLKEHAGGHNLQWFIVQALEEWLVGKPVERHTNGKRTAEWKQAVKGAQ
jgi:hypothetical protein